MFHRFSLSLSRAANLFAVFLSCVMTIVILLGVLFRYVLLKPLPWSEDLGRYLMIWLALFAVGVVMQNGKHVAVTIFIERLTPKLRLGFQVLAGLLVIGFGLAIGLFGIQYLFVVRSQISPSLHIDLWWVYMGFPFYAFLLIISTLDRLLGDIGAFRTQSQKY